MSKFMSINKQLENLAKKWYIRKYYENQIRNIDDKNLKKEFLKKVNNSLNVKEVVNEYLRENPKMKKQYEIKNKRINKLKTMAGLGLLTVAVGTCAYAKNYKEVKTDEQPRIETQIDYEKTEKTVKEIGEQKEYTQFFEKIKNISNEDAKKEEIVNFTKQKIVEAYNNQNKENQITVEQLQYLHLNETVLANKDVFGNDVSYERISQREIITPKENQELKKVQGGIYEYKINGKVVAVYDKNGQEINDNNIENKQEFFKNTISLLNETEKLNDIYKYNNSQTDIKNMQDKYTNVAKQLKVKNEEKSEQENSK